MNWPLVHELANAGVTVCLGVSVWRHLVQLRQWRAHVNEQRALLDARSKAIDARRLLVEFEIHVERSQNGAAPEEPETH